MPAKSRNRYNWNVAFRERLKLEGHGRLEQYEQAVDDYSRETGRKKMLCYQAVAGRFGFVNRDDERRRWDERHGGDSAAADRLERQQNDLRKAIASRPLTAPLPDEVEWIRNHPVMVLAATAPKGQLIAITASDVLNSPHGPAPSQASVGMLQNYALEPATFHKWYLGTYRKELAKVHAVEEEEEEDGAEEGADESVALQEALAIIRQISADAERLVRKELKAK